MNSCIQKSVLLKSDVDSDDLEFMVNEEMQHYQILHEAIIIHQNREMNEIVLGLYNYFLVASPKS